MRIGLQADHISVVGIAAASHGRQAGRQVHHAAAWAGRMHGCWREHADWAAAGLTAQQRKIQIAWKWRLRGTVAAVPLSLVPACRYVARVDEMKHAGCVRAGQMHCMVYEQR